MSDREPAARTLSAAIKRRRAAHQAARLAGADELSLRMAELVDPALAREPREEPTEGEDE